MPGFPLLRANWKRKRRQNGPHLWQAVIFTEFKRYSLQPYFFNIGVNRISLNYTKWLRTKAYMAKSKINSGNIQLDVYCNALLTELSWHLIVLNLSELYIVLLYFGNDLGPKSAMVHETKFSSEISYPTHVCWAKREKGPGFYPYWRHFCWIYILFFSLLAKLPTLYNLRKTWMIGIFKHEKNLPVVTRSS